MLFRSEELNKDARDAYVRLEEEVIDALVLERQQLIDAFSSMTEAIENSTSKVLDGMQDQIEKERQMRENEKTEQEIADKEARLAYLSRDTSGANAMEIMQLQEEIEEARQNYTDTLIDQAIQQMRDDADLAAEQRAEQQAIMEAQLEIAQKNGEIAKEAMEIVSKAISSSGSFENNAESDAAINRLKGLLELVSDYGNKTYAQNRQWLDEYIETVNKARSLWGSEDAYMYIPMDGPWASLIYNGFLDAMGEIITNELYKSPNARNTKFDMSKKTNIGGALSALRFATGGLADYTGPAWLDGSRSKPELVLNPEDTENFLILKDILSGLRNGNSSNNLGLSGDNYYSFDIQADIGSDYDVDKLAERLKYLIVQESSYRNVNAISLTR